MIIIGELINATRKTIREAIQKKDNEFILQEAVNQVNCGADCIDINCAIDINQEPDDMEWLVKIVQEKLDVPLMIDSSNPVAIERGLKIRRGKTIINSITGEIESQQSNKKISKILQLTKETGSDIVVLTMSDKGMPKTASERVSIAEKMYKIITEQYEIRPENIYFDLLVRPVSTEPEQPLEFLNGLQIIKRLFPQSKTICGLSNVSFGLPKRKLINSTFLILCLYAGLDAALVDPTDKNIIASLRATEALLGKDEYCMNYISAFKEGRI